MPKRCQNDQKRSKTIKNDQKHMVPGAFWLFRGLEEPFNSRASSFRASATTPRGLAALASPPSKRPKTSWKIS